TREILGAERVDNTSAVNIVVAVDGSASLLPSTRDGSVLALTEVLAGMSRVVSPGRQVCAAIVGDEVSWIPGDASTLPRALDDALASRSLTTSFRASSADLAARYPHENTVTYIVTDAFPAD